MMESGETMEVEGRVGLEEFRYPEGFLFSLDEADSLCPSSKLTMADIQERKESYSIWTSTDRRAFSPIPIVLFGSGDAGILTFRVISSPFRRGIFIGCLSADKLQAHGWQPRRTRSRHARAMRYT